MWGAAVDFRGWVQLNRIINKISLSIRIALK